MGEHLKWYDILFKNINHVLLVKRFIYFFISTKIFYLMELEFLRNNSLWIQKDRHIQSQWGKYSYPFITFLFCDRWGLYPRKLTRYQPSSSKKHSHHHTWLALQTLPHWHFYSQGHQYQKGYWMTIPKKPGH